MAEFPRIYHFNEDGEYFKSCIGRGCGDCSNCYGELAAEKLAYDVKLYDVEKSESNYDINMKLIISKSPYKYKNIKINAEKELIDFLVKEGKCNDKIKNKWHTINC